MDKTISAQTLASLLTNPKNTLTVLDVRRKADYDLSPQGIAGACWRDPSKVAEWKDALPTEQQIVVYCVRGGSVSQSVRQELVAAGLNAVYLDGGLEAYRTELEGKP